MFHGVALLPLVQTSAPISKSAILATEKRYVCTLSHAQADVTKSDNKRRFLSGYF